MVTTVISQMDKLKLALDGFFGIRNEQGVRPFRSLKEAYQAFNPGSPFSYIDSGLSESILREAVTSSTFGEALGDSITRRMLQEYRHPQFQAWRFLTTEPVPVNDFRTQRRARLGGYANLASVAEGGAYNAVTSPTDEEATYSVGKYGGTEELTLETIANDDVGVVRSIPVKLGRAAARTLYQHVFNSILRDNPVVSYDGLALFVAGHNNLGSSALSASSLLATENAMRDQTGYNESAHALGEANMPRTLIIPNELRDVAFKLVGSDAAVISAENATTPNLFHQGYRVIVVDDWTDGNDWIAAADPFNIPMLEVGFLNGREEPEIFVQDSPSVGSMFDADKIKIKVRHIWGVAVLDHRGLYKHVVA